MLDRCDTGDMPLHPELEKFGRCGLEGENLLRFGHTHCNETFSKTSRSELCIMRNTVVMKVREVRSNIGGSCYYVSFIFGSGLISDRGGD